MTEKKQARGWHPETRQTWQAMKDLGYKFPRDFLMGSGDWLRKDLEDKTVGVWMRHRVMPGHINMKTLQGMLRQMTGLDTLVGRSTTAEEWVE